MLLSIVYESTANQSDITFEIVIDNQSQVSHCLDGLIGRLEHEFTDTDTVGTKQIKLIMSGKNETHTVVNDNKEIVSDSAVKIQQVVLDNIDITDELCQGNKCYTHNNNGLTDLVTDEFYGYMGHNGTVTWTFALPIYKWFLDKCQ